MDFLSGQRPGCPPHWLPLHPNGYHANKVQLSFSYTHFFSLHLDTISVWGKLWQAHFLKGYPCWKAAAEGSVPGLAISSRGKILVVVLFAGRLPTGIWNSSLLSIKQIVSQIYLVFRGCRDRIFRSLGVFPGKLSVFCSNIWKKQHLFFLKDGSSFINIADVPILPRDYRK